MMVLERTVKLFLDEVEPWGMTCNKLINDNGGEMA